MFVSQAVGIFLAVSLASASAITQVKRDETTPTTTCYPTLIHPKPAHVDCGLQGNLGSDFAPFLVQSYSGSDDPLKSCESTCLEHKRCIAFGYNKGSKTCELYAKHIKSLKPQKARNGVVYYNRNCFTTTCITAGPTTTPTPTPTPSHNPSPTTTTTLGCPLTAPAPTFYLKVVPSNTPLDNMYALIIQDPENTFVNGLDNIVLASDADNASPFTFTNTCDLQGADSSGTDFYGLGDDYSGSSQSDGRPFMADQSEYDEIVPIDAPNLRPLSCQIVNGILNCMDPATGGTTWADCANDQRGIFLNKTVSSTLNGNVCYPITFTTLASLPQTT